MDQRLRELERQWREADTPLREAAYLAQRVRAGELSPRRLELLARMGHFARPPGIELLPGLRQVLAETIVWCSERTGDLRSASDPIVPLRSLVDAPRESPHGVVGQVLAQRRHMIEGEGWVKRPRARNLADGRLLLFFPNHSLTDGAAHAASGGLVDYENCPPPATWVAWFGQADSFYDCLLAWIPASAVRAVDDGVNVNPEECIQWADQCPDHPGPLLRAAGLHPGPAADPIAE